ncbi:hypothetical protein DL770_003067 [Monosporascus sp. CRB-9-2]|nr:hypothetical protein DL770_003067 [Monosporascus sp. CRB-9-2]
MLTASVGGSRCDKRDDLASGMDRVKSGQDGPKPRSRNLLFGCGYLGQRSVASGSSATSTLPKFDNGHVNATCFPWTIYEPALKARAPKGNVWARISPEVNMAVWNLLHDPEFGLNLTHPDKAGVSDNYVSYTDTVQLQMLDLYIIMDTTGAGTTLYKLKGIVTNTRFFSTVGGLRSAYKAGELKEDYSQF